MGSALQSILTLGIGFSGVVAVTLGLAAALASPTAPGEGGEPVARATPTPVLEPDDGIARLGGILAVSGDREGALHVRHELPGDRYTLVGDKGRIAFEGSPLSLVRLAYDGWDFFLDPDECAVTAHDLDTAVGIGLADVRCAGITDVRENGTITVEGTIGLPVDLLGDRVLPETGGSLEVGSETWTVAGAWLLAWELQPGAGASRHNLELVDEVSSAALHFHWDHVTGRLTLVSVARTGEERAVHDGACEVRRTELGMHNPRTTVAELRISCADVDVPGLGTVPIEGTVVVDELDPPTSG